jgi:hypothetical protein
MELTLITSVWLRWEHAYAKHYKVQVTDVDDPSEDQWNTIVEVRYGEGGSVIHGAFTPVVAQHVRIFCVERAITLYGNSLWEVQVRGNQEAECLPSSNPTLSPTLSPFSTILSLQLDVGVCDGDSSEEVGCTDPGGTIGNPSDFANCYNITNYGGTAPFVLDTVRFWIGTIIPLPSDLSVRAWAGTVVGGPSDMVLLTQNLTTYEFGENTVQLEAPLEVATEEICIGLFSTSLTDAVVVRTGTGMGNGDQSFIKFPECEVDTFTTLEALGGSLNFCIEAFAFGVRPSPT